LIATEIPSKVAANTAYQNVPSPFSEISVVMSLRPGFRLRSSAARTSGNIVSNQARRCCRLVFGTLIQMTTGPLSLSTLRCAKSSSFVTITVDDARA
jgi:hypothetical protein